MRIMTFPLGQMQTNCYLIIKNKECLIIDPGDSAEFILEQIQRISLTPLAILATHGHFDHIMAAGEIQLSFSIPMYIFEDDLFLIKRLNETAKHFLEYDPHSVQPILVKGLHEGRCTISDFEFEVIKTPGHTPGSCCYYFKEESVIFTGDTLFKEGIGRYDFSYSSFENLKRSLSIFSDLPKETVVYPGHGEETTIGAEI